MLFDSDTLLMVEWIAAALGVINISLLIFRSVWNFPFGIAMVALYIFVFFEKRLYAEAGLQVFFILAQAWGWSPNAGAPRVPRSCPRRGARHAERQCNSKSHSAGAWMRPSSERQIQTPCTRQS